MKNYNYCYTNYIIIIVSIFLFFVLVMAAFSIITNRIQQKRMQEIMRYQINVGSTIDKSIPEIMDLIINESFTDYKIKFLIIQEDGKFINSDREIEIRKDLVDIVTSRISGAVLDKLSLFYNTQNIAEILSDKIYIAVMNYVIEHNAEYNNISIEK